MTIDRKEWAKEVVSIDMTNEELAATINLLNFTMQTLAIMANTAEEHNDTANVNHLHVRIAFAKVLAEKLANNLELGDVKNKTFH